MDINYRFTIPFLILVINNVGESQSISLQGSGGTIQGEEYTLQCITNRQTVNWYQDGTYIAQSNQYNNKGCGFDSQTYSNFYEFNECGVQHELTIKSLDYNRDNGKVWTCRIIDNGVYTSSNRITVSVIFRPRFIISSTPVHGESFDLICMSTYSVSWSRKAGGDNTDRYIGRSYVGSNSCSVQSGYKSDYEFKSCGSVNQTLTIKSVDFMRDNGSIWECYNGQYNDRYTLTVTVQVSSVEIKSTNLELSTITVEESQPLIIQCVTSFAYPEPSVDLHVCNNGLDSRCDHYTATKSSENQTSITFQVTLNSTLEFDDTEVSCSARNYKTEIVNSSSVTLYILHHPMVGLRVQEAEGQLLCIAVGLPETMTFLPWRHSIDSKLVREIEGYYINTTVYSLNITNSQNNGGNYTCTVDNGISDPDTKQLNQTAYYNLNRKVQPTLYNVEGNDNLVVGQNRSFSLKYLEDKSVNVSWYHNDIQLQPNNRITIREEPTEISHPYNNNIKLSGIKTVLSITSITITDQGNYTCQVCNQYGCSPKTFEVDMVSMRKQDNGDDNDQNEDTIVILAVVVSILVVVLIIVGVCIIIKYRKYTASKRDENRPYERTVPTPAHIYDVIGTNEHDNGSSEYDRTVPVPETPETVYTTLGSNNSNEKDKTSSVYYNTTSGVLRIESQRQ